jgi:regulator of sigma E protease
MSILIAIVAFVIILIILVIAHEFAHFITAKSRGVQVIEFGVGFPPRIWGIKRGETLYSINALPLGGFVKLAGEEDPNIARSLASKGYGTRILVLASGSLMNLLLPIVIAAVAFMIPHSSGDPTLTINQVSPGSPAEMAGILSGDSITAINGQTLNSYTELQQEIKDNLGKEISITFQKPDSTIHTVQVIPRTNPPEGQGAVGIAPTFKTVSSPVWEAFPQGATYCWDALVAYKDEVGRWITGATSPQLSGIVGMTEVTGQVASLGMAALLLWAAFISLNLGIVNILPLPALDGGRIAFVFLEMIRRGKRISPKTEGMVHAIGFMLLIGLMILITFSDVSKLITNGTVLPK